MQILVATEKHSTEYWDATTPEALAASSLAILKQRFEDGYWYHRYEPRLVDFDEAVKNSGESYGDFIARLERHNDREQARADVANQWYDQVEQLCKGEIDNHMITVGGGRFARQEPLSWWLLQTRSDYEYEDVQLETLRQG